MNTMMATEFLTRRFGREETIALLLRGEEPAKITQRIVLLEQAAEPAYMRWLAHENASGMNVYAAANPLRPGSRKRTKECISQIRHVYLDIDRDGDSRIASLRASDAVPEPTAIISTSPDKYQVLWQVEGFSLALQESTLKQIASAFGGDPACTDCNRVIRVPGFHNVKYTPSHPVTVEYGNHSIANPGCFALATDSPDTVLSPRQIVKYNTARKNTHSEQDWAWVLSELKSGKDAAQLTQALAVRRADKPNPLYYAQRTVDLASARLALLAGAPMHEVVANLEARRSSQLPAALSSARAREIAHTAAGMIARQKLA